MDKLQIIERTIIGRIDCCMVSEDEGTLSSDRREIECPKPGNHPCDQRLFQGLSTASPVRAPSGRNRFHCRRTKTVGLRPTVLVPDGRPSIRPERLLRGCCSGVLHGARTIPTVAGRSMRALSRLADVAGFWTLDRTTITGRSAVILRQHTTPFRPMIVPFDDLELVYQSLRTLEPPHMHKFPRVNAQGLQIRPHSTLGREDFLGRAAGEQSPWAPPEFRGALRLRAGFLGIKVPYGLVGAHQQPRVRTVPLEASVTAT